MNSRLVIFISLMVGALSGAGLIALVYYEPPTGAFTALALLLVVLSVTGLSGPVWGVVLRRVMPKTADRTVMMMGMRFGLWGGIFLASFVLLNILGYMDSVLVLAILALLIMIEMFIQQNVARKKSSRRSRR